MKFALLFFVLVCPMMAWGEASSIRFANQDQLSGSLESLARDTLVWKSPILEKPTSFFTREVTELTLPAKPPVFSANHEAVLRLTNGDVVRGQLAGLSKEAVELDTWFAGRLVFKRSMVQNLEIRELPKVLYQGPNGMEDWTASGDDPWIYQGNAFISKGASNIGRDCRLPDTCSISFELEWRSALRFRLLLFTQNDRESGYEIGFQRRTVRFSKAGEHEWIGHTSGAAELQKNEKAQIEIRANLKTGQFAFFVDGRMVDVWTDVSVDRNNLGGGLHFISEDRSPLRISAIRVTAWDGALDQQPPPKINDNSWLPEEDSNENSDELDVPKEERIQLRNGDHLNGQIMSIVEGVVTLKTSYGEVMLPISRLRSMPLGTVDLEKPLRRKGDVRAWFYDGSSIVFRLEEVAGGYLLGSSQNFGNARFKMEAFTRLEFNIYGKAHPRAWAVTDMR